MPWTLEQGVGFYLNMGLRTPHASRQSETLIALALPQGVHSSTVPYLGRYS